MATPETSNRSPVDLKNQLRVALAGAIGLTAGAILWQAIFLRESGPSTWQLVAGWMELMLLGGSITLAWARGLSYQPKQAAKFGALTGAITGAAIELVFALSHWIFAVMPAPPIYEQIADTLLITFRWGSYGFLGGVAIEKEWGRRSAARVALGVGAVGIVIVFIQALYEGSFIIILSGCANCVASSYVRADGHWG